MKSLLGCAVTVLVLSGCTTSVPSSRSTASDAQQTPETGSALNDDEMAIAVAAAQQEISRELGITGEPATIKSATAMARSVPLKNSTGTSCTSDHLLNVKLIGRFPGVVTTGHPIDKFEPNSDFTVRAVLLTVDADSGQTCRIGVQTRHPTPDDEATVLDLG
jgi:hypothetical protein